MDESSPAPWRRPSSPEAALNRLGYSARKAQPPRPADVAAIARRLKGKVKVVEKIVEVPQAQYVADVAKAAACTGNRKSRQPETTDVENAEGDDRFQAVDKHPPKAEVQEVARNIAKKEGKAEEYIKKHPEPHVEGRMVEEPQVHLQPVDTPVPNVEAQQVVGHKPKIEVTVQVENAVGSGHVAGDAESTGGAQAFAILAHRFAILAHLRNQAQTAQSGARLPLARAAALAARRSLGNEFYESRRTSAAAQKPADEPRPDGEAQKLEAVLKPFQEQKPTQDQMLAEETEPDGEVQKMRVTEEVIRQAAALAMTGARRRAAGRVDAQLSDLAGEAARRRSASIWQPLADELQTSQAQRPTQEQTLPEESLPDGEEKKLAYTPQKPKHGKAQKHAEAQNPSQKQKPTQEQTLAEESKPNEAEQKLAEELRTT